MTPAKYRGKLILIFKDFPLPAHPIARAAHRAARAAQARGKFWDMHDLPFGHNLNVSTENFDCFAKQLGLNMDRFHRDMTAASTDALIDKDIAEGKKLGIQGTPTLFVNGHELEGVQKYDILRRLVEAQLKGEPWKAPP
jgi:protein-disulfide isomerase